MIKSTLKIVLVLIIILTLPLTACKKDPREDVDYKPVLYLYPETETDITVELDIDGSLLYSYPNYDNVWKVTANSDGILTDSANQEYYALFWESLVDYEENFETGFCIAGSDTITFLEKSLSDLGLNRREANEFIIFWLPRLEANQYNLISFNSTNYQQMSKTKIEPLPDTHIVIQMTYKALAHPVEIEAQKLETPTRSGFVAVEWGGREIFD